MSQNGQKNRMRAGFAGHEGVFRTRFVGKMLKKGRKMPEKGVAAGEINGPAAGGSMLN
jgi:hypothetical protein